MKRAFIIISILVLSVSATFAQRLAYVDSEYVLRHIPEYSAAQKQLDDMSQKWQQEVDNQYAEIEKLYQAYQNDQVLLNEETRRRREDEIVAKERTVKELQRSKFGMDGELFKQRTTLIQPIQEKVSNAIQSVATELGLDFIFDKGGELAFLYANPNLDKSNDVITKLGLKPNPSLAD